MKHTPLPRRINWQGKPKPMNTIRALSKMIELSYHTAKFRFEMEQKETIELSDIEGFKKEFHEIIER